MAVCVLASPVCAKKTRKKKPKAVAAKSEKAVAAPSVKTSSKGARHRGSAGTADKDTIKLVEYVTKVDTSDLDYAVVPPFMKVLPATLPKKLRAPYKAKRAELNALRKIAQNKKKPPIRRAGKEEKAKCSPKEGDMQYVNALRKMSFEQIGEPEMEHLMKRTRCSECELHEESSLMAVIVPAKKKGEPGTRYLFLSASDPWMSIIAEYRRGSSGGTNFFGAFHGACH